MRIGKIIGIKYSLTFLLRPFFFSWVLPHIHCFEIFNCQHKCFNASTWLFFFLHIFIPTEFIQIPNRTFFSSMKKEWKFIAWILKQIKMWKMPLPWECDAIFPTPITIFSFSSAFFSYCFWFSVDSSAQSRVGFVIFF